MLLHSYIVGAGTDGCKHFGSAMKSFRLNNDLTPPELAEKANVHVSFIRGIERGVQSPSIETAKKLLACFDNFGDGVEVSWVNERSFDLVIKNGKNIEVRYLFSSEKAGQNKRPQKETVEVSSGEVYVAMRSPNHDGSGETKILGIYSDRVLAEARCFRDMGTMQPLSVIMCELNSDLEET